MGSVLGFQAETLRSNAFGFERHHFSSESIEDQVRALFDLPNDLIRLVFTRRELEQRLRELKRRKKEKKQAKLKEFEEEREKDKKRWTDFNSKVSLGKRSTAVLTLSLLFQLTGRTWKGVVSKSMVKTDKRSEQLRGTTNGYLVSNYKPAQPRP